MLALALLAGAALARSAGAATPTTTRVSISSSGAESDGVHGSYASSISADGRFIAFLSTATNFAPGDTNGKADVFLRDRKTGETSRISVSNDGAQSDGATLHDAQISADGRYVAFVSNATTLDPNGSAGLPRLYRYDRLTSTVQLIPLPTGASSVAGTNPGGSHWPSVSISANGERIAFRSSVSGIAQVWWWDQHSGNVRLASANASGAAGNGSGSFDAAISGDGRSVAFTSGSTNLGPLANPSYRDVFVKNLDSGAIDRVSDVPGAGNSNAHSSTPALSYDGCIVAFYSDATNLVAGDSGSPHPKVFVRDRCGGSGTTLLSVEGANSETKFQSLVPISISADGCRIAFLRAGGDSAQMRDRCKGTTTRLDVSTAGAGSGGGLWDVSLSATGRYVTFSTTADTLVAGDTNGAPDVFLRDLADNTAPVAKISPQINGLTASIDGSASYDPDGYELTSSINWGDGTPLEPALVGLHTYAGAGTYGVTLTVTDADGLPSTAFAALTVAPAPGPFDRGPIKPDPGGDDNGGPIIPAQLILDRVSLSRSRFRTGKKTDSSHGATLNLRLTDAATVTVTIERQRKGRKIGGRCKIGAKARAKKHGKKRPACTAYKRDGVITRTLGAGSQRIAISGMIGKKRLAPGKHRLTVRARSADGRQTATKTLNFTVLAPKKHAKKKGK